MALRCLLVVLTALLNACSTPADRAPEASSAAMVVAAPQQEVPAASTAVAKDDDPYVCKWTSPAGTRISRKTCVRQSELDQAKQNSQSTLETLQRKAANQAPNNNN